MIISTNKQLDNLVSSGVLTLNEQGYWYTYKNNPTLLFNPKQYSSASPKGTPEAKNILAENFPNLREEIFIYYSSQALIDYLYYKHNKQPAYFKNGKIRSIFLDDAYNHLKNQHKEFPSIKLIAKEITEIWEDLTEERKQQFSFFFTEKGEYKGSFKNVLIVKEQGNVERQKLPESSITVCTSLLADLATNHYGETLYITNTTIKNNTITIKGEDVKVSKGELFLLNKYYTVCSSCGKLELNENIIFGICIECAGNFPKVLSGYSTKATDSFSFAVYTKGKYPSRLLGVELEYELIKNSSLKETLFLLHKNLKNHAIFKRDGSLTNGIEICTRPASLDIHEGEFKKMFDEPLLEKRLQVLPSCGMHVHIDKSKMSALALGKLISFIQNKENQKALQKIAGREANTYSKLGTNHSITSLHRGTAQSDRYQGINLQNAETSEIRIFRTPKDFPTFMKNMEFVSALSEYVQPCNSGVKENTFDHFLHFVNKNTSTYKELSKFIKQEF